MGRAASLCASLLLLLSCLSGRIDSQGVGVGDLLQQLADRVEDSYEKRLAGKSSRYLEKQLSGVDFASADALSPAFLKRVSLAAQLSLEAYAPKAKGCSQRVLSRDSVGKADCFARLVKGKKSARSTLWVVVRGTATRSDIATDLSFFTHTQPIGNFEVPALVAQQANAILQQLVSFVEELEGEGVDLASLEVVVFAGHSLGGAIAQAVFLHWQSTHWARDDRLIGEVFTFGAPQLIATAPSEMWGKGSPSELPAFFRIAAVSPPALVEQDTIYARGVRGLASRVHNIVYMLDPVPRMLGSHPLPPYLQPGDETGASSPPSPMGVLKEVLKGGLKGGQGSDQDAHPLPDLVRQVTGGRSAAVQDVDNLKAALHSKLQLARTNYTPYGRYYQLRPTPSPTSTSGRGGRRAQTYSLQEDVSLSDSMSEVEMAGTSAAVHTSMLHVLPEDWPRFLYSAAHEHSITRCVDALKSLAP